MAEEKKKITNPLENFESHKGQTRRLKQYQNLTDAEWEEVWDRKIKNVSASAAWEKRIQNKLDEFAQDYALEDLKVNDKATLRTLASATLRLEEYDSIINQFTAAGIDEGNIIVFEKLSKAMEGLRSDISKMSDDLRITRKSRKGDKETSVMAYLDDLKLKARSFMESRSLMIWCPKCNFLLAQLWFLYPNTTKNKVRIVCQHKLEDNSICGEVVEFNSKEIFDAGGRNLVSIPDSMK
jgi:hypothetical protein